jgi:chemotaxis signal transduction protein
MMELENARADSFVLLQLAERRFALPADRVAELAPPVRLHQFPHTSRLLAGVIVRRGKILPVYDAARALSGESSFSHRFYLVVRRTFGESTEMSAIPVEGECELITGEARPVREAAPAYICGEISVGSESIGVLDIEAFVRLHEVSAADLPEVRA